MSSIEAKISQLTPGLLEELEHYLDYLINKRKIRKPGKLSQDWAGGLKGVNFTAVELQKKALDWRKK